MFINNSLVKKKNYDPRYFDMNSLFICIIVLINNSTVKNEMHNILIWIVYINVHNNLLNHNRLLDL